MINFGRSGSDGASDRTTVAHGPLREEELLVWLFETILVSGPHVMFRSA